MSEPFDSPQDARAAGEAEEIDALPVPAIRPRIVPAQPHPGALSAQRPPVGMLPAVQAAAVAAGGFVAGAAVVGLVHRRQRRSAPLARGRRARRELKARQPSRAAELVQIVGSRSLLVDVHLLGSGGDR
jgi:hypothetical protein